MSSSNAMIGAPTNASVTEDTSLQTLIAAGTISISDSNAGQAAFKTAVTSTAGNLGTLTLAANGFYSYSVADSVVQYLGAGQTKIDTFTVTSVDGTTKQVSFTIHGTNDAAIIGTPTVHDVTEDASNPLLTASGSISIADADQGQASFQTTVTAAAGDLGHLALAANGTYTYSVTDSNVQYLGAGQTKIDTFTVTSLDGTQKQVSFTIHGTNDAAVIGLPTVADVTEDATNPILYAAGTVSISDADQGQAFFQPTIQAGSGNVGALVMGPNGAYIYVVLDAAVQYLGAGDVKVDTFTITSLDGTTKQISFTVHGTNDAAVIGTPTVSTVTEDSNVTGGNLTATGSISISDADQHQSLFQTTVTAAGGDLGHLVIAVNGAYTYSVADSAVQYLGAADTRVDTFTITSLDGTQKQVSFTIHGTNDAAVIGTPTVADVIKNASLTTLTAAGTISISDLDQNQAAFKTSVVSAAGDLGHLVITANGSYTYSVAESAVQSLTASATKIDTFTVTSLDGTQKQVSFTIHGGSVNTPAAIGNPSVSDVTENPILATLTASGTIPITDPDAGQAAFQTAVNSASSNLGSLVLTATGSYTYTVADSAVQFLGAGQTKTETFTVTSVDGTTKQVVFTIHGINNTAVIGDPAVHDVTQAPAETTLTASGTLTISDLDQGQAAFQTAVVAASGTLGHLTVAANGAYTYSVDNAAIQYLGATDTKTESFTVTSLDGTQKLVSFTLHGINDAAAIGTPSVSSVTEDVGVVGGILTASGSISVVDPDQNQSSFQTAVAPAPGNLGMLTLAANGTYTYSVTDSAVQYLGASDTRTESFTVTSLDGTQKQVSFAIHGANDAATIGAPTVHDVIQDTGVVGGNLTATGTISVADPDQNQSSFQTVVTASPGDLGSLVMHADGSYVYSVANSLVDASVGPTATQIDTFTVTSLDGTQQQVSFDIHGIQHAPALTVGSTANGIDDTATPLSISAGLVDTGSTLTVGIAGVPSGYTLNHGSVSDDGSTWFVNPADLSSLSLVPAAGAKAGVFDLHVTAFSNDGAATISSSSDITVTIAHSASETSGLAEDGYIAGATVFADTDGNGKLDAGEAFTTTNADGSFTLTGGSGPLVMTGGTDISTNLAFTGTLSAPEGSTVVTPLTTLIAAIVATSTPDHIITAADAAGQVASAFGLDPTKNLTSYDPVADAVNGNASAAAILSAGVQVQSTVAQVSAVGAHPADVFAAIATSVSANATASTAIDLSNSSTVGGIVSGSHVDANAVAAVTNVVSAANGSIQDAGSDVTHIVQAAVVAQGSTTQQLTNTDFSSPGQVASLQTNTEGAALTNSVAAAPVGVTGLALLGTLGADILTGTSGNDAIDGLDGNDTISGGAGNDLLYGNTGNDLLIGGPGDDRLDGGPGTDRASYADAAAGVAIDLTAGTAHGIAAGDVANVGNDTLVSIEEAVGSAFADTYNAAGFTGSTGVPGVPAGFNEFEGGGGNDTIVGTVNAAGEILTRVSYLHASAGVTVDLAAGAGHGTAAGDVANVGTDTFVNVNAVTGSQFADVLLGSNNPGGTYEQFDGRGGNDLINGLGGYDFAVYNLDPNTTTGITVHLAAGTVTGDATIGTDALLSVEGIRGTSFADTYDATGFSGTSANAGSLGAFNNFDGEGGNDVITGNGDTRLQYSQSLAAVTVDLAAGTAHGTAAGDIANVGTDTFTGVNAVMGSMFDDTLLGDAGNDTFQGLAGNDYIDGRGGFDVAQYNNLTYTTGSITVNMAAGIVVGDATNGTDTLRSVEGVQGTNDADIYDATGYGLAGALNVGNNGTFNQFEGLGGNDTITGNGNTRLLYSSATAGVTVDIATGTATGDASVGTDSFTGVNSVYGSTFADTLIGDAGSNTFTGGAGNDSIDGGGGADLADFTGVRSAYNITFNTPGAGQVQVADTVAGRDGTDTLANIEIAQFTDQSDLLASGSAGSPINLSDNRLSFGAVANPLNTLTGSADDFVAIGQSLNGHQINLGAGNDTVILGVTGNYSLNLLNVEHVAGTAGNDFVTLTNNTAGLSIDLGAGNDTLVLANGANSISVGNVETINGSDFTTASNDTLTLLDDVGAMTVNLGLGVNTLNLAAGTNAFINLFDVDTVHGTASDDALTLVNGASTISNDMVIDLGAGNDTLTVGGSYSSFSLLNTERLVGDALDNSVSLNNDVTGLSIDLGAGNDTLDLASGTNTVSVTNVESINTSDYFGGTAAVSNDALTLLDDISGITINLQQGTNSLTLAAGTNALTEYNIQQIDGSASDDHLTLQNQIFGVTVDLGAGNDTLQLADGGNNVTVDHIETVNGGNGNDGIIVADILGTTTVTGGLGQDVITASAGAIDIRFTSAADSADFGGGDTVNSFDATKDAFVFDHVAGLASSVHFVGVNGTLDGHGQSEAVLNGTTLQIDVNGDGVIGAGDMEVYLNGLAGSLSDANFIATGITAIDHAPTNIDLAGSIVAENSPIGAFVGVLTSTDQDPGDTATYSLTGNAGGAFAISGNELVVAGPIDYETNPTEQVTVRVTDSGGLSFDKSFTIGVTNVNEAPTDIALAGGTVAENSANGTVVGVLTSADPDAGDTATYSLTGSAGGAFAISSNEIVVAGPIDYEINPTEQVTVRVTDSGGLSFDKTFTIGVTDVNEAPTAVALSNQTVSTPENGGDVKVADIAVTDDALGSDVLSLSGADAASFRIVTGANGPELHFLGGANFEAKASYDVTVLVNDVTASNHVSPDASQTFHLAVINIDETPTDITLSGASVGQSSAAGTVVGSLSAVDPDAGDTAAFSLIDGDGGQFALNGGNVVVAGTLAAGPQQIVVRDTDSGGLTFDKTLTINVSNGATVTGTAGNDVLTGTAGDDVIQGLAGNDKLQGLAGNDTIDGGQGFDQAVYADATAGISFNLASGTVNGSAAGIGTDTLVNIEGIVGTNFADTYDPTGFSGDSGIAGNPLGLNLFEGGAGNDTIISETNSQGALLTRISYVDATAGVTVDLQAKTATGDASVGTDTLVGNGFGNIIGSQFADTLNGSNNASGTVEVFDGRGGNDTFNGRGGFDRADYNNDPATTAGVTVNMAAGTVVGDATIGTDTLRSIEAVRGTNFADTYVATGFSGTSTNAGSNGTFNEFTGGGGDDSITGNGATRLSYTTASAGVTINITAGTAHGTAAGDVANVGHDTFTGVNAVMGSMFDDSLTGSGNTAATETFTGLAGNDFIDGQGGFDIAAYENVYFTTGSVAVNMAAGIVVGDASNGTDTLRSIEGVSGTNFNDTYDATGFGLTGALNVGNNGTFNQFEGLGGNDTVTGNGATRVIYSSATGGVSINMAVGTATGDASVGTDTFTGVNSATGSSSADTYNAVGFVGGVGASNSGTFNLFEGLGGNDTITGNGNTRVAYTQAAAAVTVDLSLGTAHGTAGGDVAGVGADTITGGVNSVQGSNFNDTLIGGSGAELFFGGSGNDSISAGAGNDQITGGVGNDTIDGGAGTDVAIYTGPAAAYTITTPGAGQTQVADSVTTRDGTDILTNVELLQFTDSTVMIASGTSAVPIDISGIGFGSASTPLTGTAGDDFLMVGGNVFGHQVNLGAGNDTVALAPGGGFYQLNLVNVEHVAGSTGDDNITLVNDASGLAVDLGSGNNGITLANGVNSLNITNVQNVGSADFSGTLSNDTLTLLDDVSGLTVNLQQGNNTLDLAAGNNTFIDIFNVQHVNGTASDDNLILTDTIFEPGQNPIIDLGAGNNTLTFGSQFEAFTALNVQHIVGTASDGGLTINNDISGVDVTLGGGNDNLSLAAGIDSVSIHNIANVGFNDFAAGTSSDDTLTLLNDVSGVIANGANGENTLNLAAGSNSFTDIYNFQHINGTASDDTLTVTQQIGAQDAVHIDLGGGDNTLNLDVAGATLDLVNVQHLNADGQDSFVGLLSDVSGLSVDFGGGNDTLALANGTNSIDVTNVENVNGSDFTAGINPSDDTLNLLNDVTGVSFNLGDGDNTINLAAGNNSVDNLFNINHVNGTASDDVLSVTQQSFGTVFDMGGGNDTIFFGSTATNVAVNNAETIIGSAFNDTITANSTSGVTSIAGGLGADTITIGSGAAAIHYASAAESSVGNGDTVVNFDAASDTFTFSGMTGGPNGFTGPIHFQGAGAFDGTAGAPHSEARIDTAGGQNVLQIDVNGDGQFGANDIEIHLANLAGTLHDANFLLV